MRKSGTGSHPCKRQLCEKSRISPGNTSMGRYWLRTVSLAGELECLAGGVRNIFRCSACDRPVTAAHYAASDFSCAGAFMGAGFAGCLLARCEPVHRDPDDDIDVS